MKCFQVPWNCEAWAAHPVQWFFVSVLWVVAAAGLSVLFVAALIVAWLLVAKVLFLIAKALYVIIDALGWHWLLT